MLHPPGKCRACGAVFPVTAVAASNSTGITFSGCATSCPSCGGRADILDGTYDFIGDTVRLLSGPESTADVLRQLAKTVRDSVEAGESADKTLERVTEIAPWLGSLKRFAKGQAINFIWSALGIIAGHEYTQYRDGLNAEHKREQQIQITQEGARRDREAQQWDEFQARMRATLPEPPPVSAAQRSHLTPCAMPFATDFPNTMNKLAAYAKQTRQGKK